VAEMALLPAQEIMRKTPSWEGVKSSRGKKEGEIGRCSIIEDVTWGCRDQHFFPELVPVLPAKALGAIRGW